MADQRDDTPEMRERHAAWRATYDAATARGMDDAKARIEGAKAYGDCARRQAGEPDPEPGHIGPRLVLPLTHLPPIPVCPCRWCRRGAHATACTVHDPERDDGECSCGYYETGMAPGPTKVDPTRAAAKEERKRAKVRNRSGR